MQLLNANILIVQVMTVVLVTALASRAETLENVKSKIIAKFDAVTSASYDMATHMEMSNEGFSMKMSSSGKCELAQTDKVWKMRIETKSSTEKTVAGNSTKTMTETLSVLKDGVMHTQSDTDGNKSVIKTKAENWGDLAGGEAFFKHMADSGPVVLLPDESVNGEACFVIGVKSKVVDVVSSRYYFGKSSGMVMKMTTTNPDATPGMTMTVSNLKLGATIPVERFAYTPPAGVTVTDMTKE